MRLLLLQSHALAAHNCIAALGASGAVVDHVVTLHDALMYLVAYEYDTLVLDQALADMDGCDAIRRIRGQGYAIPILLLSDSTNGKDRAQALRTGADDLLSKPFDREELIARVESIVRRRNGHVRSVLTVGPLHIDMSNREVRVDGNPMNVTRKEYSILELMALRKGRVIPKQNFLDHLYNGIDGPETRVIDVFICNLRKKLATLGLGALIDTVRGHGYIMRELNEVQSNGLDISKPAGFERHLALR